MPRARDDRQAGFTLIELLVVVVIIGILIAIAVPLYLNYRKGANDKTAASDLRGAMTTFEQCLADTTAYPSAVTATGSATCGSTTVSARLSTNSSMVYFASSDQLNYIATTTNSGGSGKIYCYSTARGGSVTTTTTALTVYRAVC